MSEITRERLIVIAISETSDLAKGTIRAVMGVASNVPNRDELIGLLQRAQWSVGHGNDRQLDGTDANALAYAAWQAAEKQDEEE